MRHGCGYRGEWRPWLRALRFNLGPKGHKWWPLAQSSVSQVPVDLLGHKRHSWLWSFGSMHRGPRDSKRLVRLARCQWEHPGTPGQCLNQYEKTTLRCGREDKQGWLYKGVGVGVGVGLWWLLWDARAAPGLVLSYSIFIPSQSETTAFGKCIQTPAIWTVDIIILSFVTGLLNGILTEKVFSRHQGTFDVERNGIELFFWMPDCGIRAVSVITQCNQQSQGPCSGITMVANWGNCLRCWLVE